MSNPKKQEMMEDQGDQSNLEDYNDSSSANSPGVETSTVGSQETGITERLTDILVDEGDGDLSVQQNAGEDRFLQWLQALDMQVLGACRADERLKPMLKSNASCGVAEDRLLAHLNQHFEPSEVCMLARCFCIPLVTIRVGKINREGTLLCPTAIRGNLSLTVLPTSDLRLSFIGDDGRSERLFTLSRRSGCSAAIDEIPADNSGRSFQIKVPSGRVLYFWCSERSKLLGIELILKMKDILKRKPSIAELTGINESRLGYLATHLRAYLMGSSLGNTRVNYTVSAAPSSSTATDISETTQNVQLSSTSPKSHRTRCSSSQAVKGNSLYQSSLSPRSSSFKDGLTRNLASLRTTGREKLRRRGDNYLSVVDNLAVTSPVTSSEYHSNEFEIDNLSEVSSCKLPPRFLESLTSNPATQVSSPDPSPFLSPHYCWCPLDTSMPLSSSLQPTTSSTGSPLLPPLSSLLSANNRSSDLLKPNPPLSLSNMPSLDFPAFLPDPLVRLQMPSSQQIPTFTPLMCDPIVHIPVIDICSSGQGYLVSAGPAISTTIPPLHPKLVNPLIPESDSMVDKGARETLRLLISSSSQTNPPLMDVLPAVLTSADEKQSSILLAGSRGLYCGTRDVNAVGSSISYVSFSESLPSIGDMEKLDGDSVNLNIQSGGDFSDDVHFREESIG